MYGRTLRKLNNMGMTRLPKISKTDLVGMLYGNEHLTKNLKEIIKFILETKRGFAKPKGIERLEDIMKTGNLTKEDISHLKGFEQMYSEEFENWKGVTIPEYRSLMETGTVRNPLVNNLVVSEPTDKYWSDTDMSMRGQTVMSPPSPTPTMDEIDTKPKKRITIYGGSDLSKNHSKTLKELVKSRYGATDIVESEKGLTFTPSDRWINENIPKPTKNIVTEILSVIKDNFKSTFWMIGELLPTKKVEQKILTEEQYQQRKEEPKEKPIWKRLKF